MKSPKKRQKTPLHKAFWTSLDKNVQNLLWNKFYHRVTLKSWEAPTTHSLSRCGFFDIFQTHHWAHTGNGRGADVPRDATGKRQQEGARRGVELNGRTLQAVDGGGQRVRANGRHPRVPWCMACSTAWRFTDGAPWASPLPPKGGARANGLRAAEYLPHTSV